jgi:RNA polymerase sigma-70 factor, ECF subfamily
LVVVLSDRRISVEIIESCRRGDREAFRSLYEAYKDRVYSVAFHFFRGDTAAAADATQQVFLKLMTTIGQFRGESDFTTWLHRIVVNICVDGARQAVVRKAEHFELQPARFGTPASQEQEMAKEEIAGSVQKALGTLPPKLRMPILLRYFEDLSYTEMAHALNCSVGTAASRLSRGQKMLAEKLASLRAPASARNSR